MKTCLIIFCIVAAGCAPHEFAPPQPVVEPVVAPAVATHTGKVRIVDIAGGRMRMITWIITFQCLDTDGKWKCEVDSKHPLIKALGYVPGQYPLQPSIPFEKHPLLHVTVEQSDLTKSEVRLVSWGLVER